jgi:hypothetical protein
VIIVRMMKRNQKFMRRSVKLSSDPIMSLISRSLGIPNPVLDSNNLLSLRKMRYAWSYSIKSSHKSSTGCTNREMRQPKMLSSKSCSKKQVKAVALLHTPLTQVVIQTLPIPQQLRAVIDL